MELSKNQRQNSNNKKQGLKSMELCKVTFVSCLGVQGYYVTLIPEPYREEV